MDALNIGSRSACQPASNPNFKYLFECTYQFKLRFLYGFNPPLHEALGYGKGCTTLS